MKSRIVLFTQGYFGALLEKALRFRGIEPVIYTYAFDATRKKGDTGYLRTGFPYRYIHERRYIPEKISFQEKDIVICADWTKDFFHGHLPAVPVYHIQPALLPKYRGYGAVSEQFLKGVNLSGMTLYRENGHIDAGDILFQDEIRINHNDYPQDFLALVAEHAAERLRGLTEDNVPPGTPQDNNAAFYVQRRRQKQALMDFAAGALYVYNQIRAYGRPYFGSYFLSSGRQIIVWKALCEKWAGIYGIPGEVIGRTAAGVEIACGEGTVVITEAEIEGVIYKGDLINI